MMMKGLKQFTWDSSAQKREGSGDPISIYTYLKVRCKEDEARLSMVVPSTRTRGSEYKLEHKRLPLSTRMYFYTMRDMELWNRLPRRSVVSLDISKSHPDMVLGTLLWVSYNHRMA